MTLYLQVRIGPGRYLLDAAHIVGLEMNSRPPLAAIGQGAAAKIDFRALLGEGTAGESGHCVLYDKAAGEPAALVVDRAEGVIDLADDELRALPPIGPLGDLLDAISLRLVEDRPMLRLRADRAALRSSDPGLS